MEEAYWLVPTLDFGTLRLAAAIPSPGAGVLILLGALSVGVRRGRRA